jgi:hypothetical protein
VDDAPLAGDQRRDRCESAVEGAPEMASASRAAEVARRDALARGEHVPFGVDERGARATAAEIDSHKTLGHPWPKGILEL